MTLALIFWVLMLVWLALSVWTAYSPVFTGPPWISTAFLFLLLLVLGWGTFGAPVR